MMDDISLFHMNRGYKSMEEKELNLTVTEKYFELNSLFMQFFREN